MSWERRPIGSRRCSSTCSKRRLSNGLANLFDRLGIHVVRLPLLVERLDDVPPLAKAILTRKAQRAKVATPALRPADIDRLMSHSWPGNVRDLANTLEHYLVWGALPSDLSRAPTSAATWQAEVPGALNRHRGNKRAAARALGISRQTLYQYLRAVET